MELFNQKNRFEALEHALASCAGVFYRINLTQNIVPGTMIQVIDDQEYSLNQQIGLPENARFSDVVDYWGNQLADSQRPDYFAFFSISNLLDHYHRGQSHVSHRYWTKNALFEPMLAQQHIVMFPDTESEDILAFTYIIDQTKQHREQIYTKKLEESRAVLESQLEERSEQLDMEHQYLTVLAKNYVLVFQVDLNTDSAEVLKLAPHSNVWKILQTTSGNSFVYSQCIEKFAELFVVDRKKDFAKMLGKDYILRQMKTVSRFSARFTCTPNLGGSQYCEAQVVRVNPDVFDGKVLVVSREIDDEVIAEQQRQAELDAEREYLNILTQDFMVAYHVNLYENTSILIKADPQVAGYDSLKVSLRRVNNYQERVNLYCDRFVVPDLRAEFRQVMTAQNLLTELKTLPRLFYRYRIIVKEDGMQYFEVQILPMDQAKGDVLIAFRHIDDVVTAEQRHQIQLEEQLQQEQNQNEVLAALGRNYHAIFLIDLPSDTYEQIACREEVRQYYKQNEPSAARALAHLCNNIISPEFSARMRRFFDLTTLPQRLLHTEATEIECVVNDGNWHRARFIVKRRDEEGYVVSVLYVTQIIDEEKQYLDRLTAQIEHANFANKSKTEFISQVAHDIRTPMNAIFGFLEIAQANIDNKEKLSYALSKIRTAGNFLNDLANDVLDITRMESGRLSFQATKTDVADLLDDIAASMSNAKFNKKQHFHFDFDRIIHPYVLLDPLRVRQVYINILSNAIKYTPDGGYISFTVCQEELPNSDKVRLIATITDSGIGMSDEFMGKMFTKFERATDTRVNAVSGFGLGLSIAKQLVELMNGTLEIHSKLGQGTTVCITLDVPYIDDEQSADGPAVPDHASLCAGMHLLVAEDNEMSREIIVELLSMSGISCDCAEDGVICLQRLQAASPGQYDAILMDMQMPNMNGPEAAMAIRALPTTWTKTIPIIAMTANALKDDIAKCLDAGMNSHLSKPVDMQQLLKVLSQQRIAKP